MVSLVSDCDRDRDRGCDREGEMREVRLEERQKSWREREESEGVSEQNHSLEAMKRKR
jgi:hypothetical protein